MSNLTEAQILSFWNRVGKSAPVDCWEWTGGRNGKTKLTCYGVAWFNGTKHRTHRLAFELSKGKHPGEKLVCHTCDNPPCCNPNHLFLGTNKDNVQDCLKKGRGKKESGSRRYNAKLTEEIVAEIKAQAPFRKYGWGRAMAKKYGVAPTAINNIVRGRRWKQVGEPKPIPAMATN